MMFENEEEEQSFRRMLEEDKDQHSLIDDNIRNVIKENACAHFFHFGDFAVGRVVTIAEVIDEYGELHLISFGSPGIKPWELSGMLRYIDAIGD